MADKNILQIPIDSSEWDSFVDRFMQYQKTLDDQPEKWAGTTQGIKGSAKAFDAVQKSFNDLVKVSVDPKFADKSSGVFARFEKSSKQVASYWKDTERSLEKGSKSFEKMDRSLLKWSGLMKWGVGAGIGIAGAVVAGTEKGVNDLAAQNKANRALGLKPGEQAAFLNAFEPAGADDALLAKIAAAKGDPTKWNGLFAAGITKDEIISKDPEALAAELLQKAGHKFNQLGAVGGTWASQTGVTDFLDTNQLRLAGSYNDQQYGGMQDRYNTTLPKFAADQATLDQATKSKQDFDKAWTELDLAFDKAVTKIAPDVTKMVDGFADWASAFVDSKEFKSDVAEFEAAAKDLASAAEGVLTVFKWMDKVSANLPGDEGQVGNGVWDFVKDFATGHFDEALKDLNRPIVATAPDDTDSGADTSSADFENKMLAAIAKNESHGNPNALNKTSGAAGLMGIMPANYQAAGINPYDPIANFKLGKQIYDEKLARYHGDAAKAAASYDGFGGLDADIAKYGDKWRDHIGEYQSTGETIEYLKRLERQGIDLSGKHAPDKSKFDKPDPSLFIAPGADDFSALNSTGQGKDNTKAAIAAQVQKYKDEFSSAMADGAGSKYFGSDNRDQQARPVTYTPTPATVNLNVVTQAPPGHSTTVTAGSLGGY